MSKSEIFERMIWLFFLSWPSVEIFKWLLERLREKYKELKKEKQDIIRALELAKDDLVYNQRPGVGNPKVNFNFEGIQELLSYNKKIGLPDKEEHLFRDYIKGARFCSGKESGNNVYRPGNIKGKSTELLVIVNKYKAETEGRFF